MNMPNFNIPDITPENIQGMFVYMIGFIHTLYYWDVIWLAACGGNGRPQPEELWKLGAFYFLCIHVIQYQFFSFEFNIELAGILVASIGVVSWSKSGKSLPKIFPNKQQKSDEEESTPRG